MVQKSGKAYKGSGEGDFKMKKYLNQLQHILDNGSQKEDRTGTGTLSVFGMQERYDLRDGFPLVTTKRIHWKSVVHELLWFLSGRNDVKWLQDHGVSIWDEFALKDGTIGRGYGTQWREWRKEKIIRMYIHPDKYAMNYDVVDQIPRLIHQIQTNPTSRRHIVSAWNVGELDQMALPPCHMMFQVNVEPYNIWHMGKECMPDSYVSPSTLNKSKGYIDLQMYQRSADMFLGVPFNIASYSLLLLMIAKVTGYTARYFIHTMGDAHIYLNHIDQVKEQLGRKPRHLPDVELLMLDSALSRNAINVPDGFIWEEDFKHIDLCYYSCHDAIKGKVSV